MHELPLARLSGKWGWGLGCAQTLITNRFHDQYVAQRNRLLGYPFRLSGHEPEDSNDKLLQRPFATSYCRSSTRGSLPIRGSRVRGSLGTGPETDLGTSRLDSTATDWVVTRLRRVNRTCHWGDLVSTEVKTHSLAGGCTPGYRGGNTFRS